MTWTITKKRGNSIWFVALIKKGNFRFAKHLFGLVISLRPGEIITIEREENHG